MEINIIVVLVVNRQGDFDLPAEAVIDDRKLLVGDGGEIDDDAVALAALTERKSANSGFGSRNENFRF